jgi:hypothetical protein
VRIVGSLKKLHGGKLEGKDGRRGGLLATVILDRIKERRGVWRKKAYPNYPDPELMNWSSELFRVTSIWIVDNIATVIEYLRSPPSCLVTQVWGS